MLPEAENVCNQMHLGIPRVMQDVCSFQHAPDKVHLKEDKAQDAYALHRRQDMQQQQQQH